MLGHHRCLAGDGPLLVEFGPLSPIIKKTTHKKRRSLTLLDSRMYFLPVLLKLAYTIKQNMF